MKRLISVILTLTMMLSLVNVVPVQAASYDENSYTLTGVQVNDVVGIAKTQIGYKEGNNSNQLDGTVSGNGNYTKYAKELKAAGYGASNPNAWCAYFVSWCAMKAGCLNSAVSFFTGVKSCVAKSKPYKSNGLGTYHAIKNYTFTKGSVFRKDYTPSNIENYKPKKGDIMIFKTHVGLVVSDYNSSTDSFSIVEGNWGGKVNSRTVKMSNSELVGFVTPDYTTTTITPTHTHSYSYSNDSAHPHSEYKYCSCGNKEYTSSKNLIASCQKCYPIGNVNLTRSFEKTKGTATFYRNNVSNATKYTLKVYRNDDLYDTYTMNSDEYYVSGLPSGEYYAILYANNANTGEERSDSCPGFKIADSYTVSYNANGGIGSISSQTKIEDEPMTLTTKTPTKTGHIFKGWASSKNATEAQYQAGGTYTKNAKITLYAVWEPETYTIKFDANGGKGEIADITITYGDAIRIPNDVLCDYSYLKGWSTSKTATTETYKIGMDYKFDANTTLYAVWGTSTWTGGVSTSLSGSGTEADPYLISSEADLGYLANKVNNQTSAPQYEYYKLTDNINLTYNEWVPIGVYGNENQYFCGSFDGNGFTISDLYITKENEKNIGLFGYVKNSEIKNLTVTGAIESITSTNVLNIGGIVAYAENSSLKELNVMYFNIGGISVKTTDYTRTGTIAGCVIGGSIHNCASTDSHIDLKSGKFEAGIIAGYSNADIIDCTAVATEGGLFSTQTTVGEFRLGGLCGNLSATAERCTVYAPYLSNNIKTTTKAYVGGFAGYLDGEAKVCSAQFSDTNSKSIATTGAGYVGIGGLVGEATDNGKISDCKFNGSSVYSSSTGEIALGGLFGNAIAKENPAINIVGGQFLSKESLPKHNGYIATWYTDIDMTEPYDFSSRVTGNLTLYAKWEKGDDESAVWDGTSKEPAYNATTKTYTITSAEELAWVSDVTNGVITSGVNFPNDVTFSGYKIDIANDIYLNDISDRKSWESSPPKNKWKGIGGGTNGFAGTLNGNNHTIYGIYHYATYTTAGFGFIYKNYGKINYLYLSDSYVYVYNPGSNPRYVAALAAISYGDMNHCHIIGNTYVYGGDLTAGLVGNVEGGAVNYCSCSSGVSVHGENYIGGIAGGIHESTIEKSYNKGYIESNGAYSYGIGGICGRAESYSLINDVHNSGTVLSDSNGGAGICGQLTNTSVLDTAYNIGQCDVDIISQVEGEAWNCYYTSKMYNSSGSEADIQYCYKKSLQDMKNLSISGFWECSSDVNDGYPYLKTIKYVYDNYTITTVIDGITSAINRSFVNVEGELSAESDQNANVGGIIGQASGEEGANSTAQNSIVIIDNIISTSSNSLYKGNAGNVVGNNSNSVFAFDNAYYNSEINVNSSSNTYDTTGIPKSEKAMNYVFYTNLLRLTPYVSLANIENDEKAVWILKNGQLPELYYNCLNDITISKDIENGFITIDKTQAVDGEVVTITATPNDGYVLNKVYVDGVEQDGTTFIVDGNDEVYVTFAEEIAEYNVTISANDNATGSLVNMDSAEPMLMSVRLMSSETDSTITAKDGEEILVNANADTDYTVDAIYVNGEEVAGNSFILTEDSVVTMDVTNISTDIVATTNDAEDVGSYFAVVSGSVSGEDENAVKYIRYWSAEDAETVYVTEVESGSGDYTTELMDLEPETTYYYQMTEAGEIKSFTTYEEPVDEHTGDEDGGYDDSDETESQPITSTTYKTLTSTYKFSIECSQALTTEFLAIACYDNTGKLLALKQVECDGDTSYTGSVPIDANIDYAKIFVWSSASNLKPLAGVEIVDIID